MKSLPLPPLRSLLPIALGVVGACQPLIADFSGYYDLGTPTIYSTDGSSIVGNWTYTISTFGTGSAVVDTTARPNALILAALAPPDSRVPVSSARPASAVHVGEALAEAKILAQSAGTFSFDVDTTVSTPFIGMTGALVAFDSTTTYDLTTGSHFVLTLDAGEEFGFRATAVRVAQSWFLANPTYRSLRPAPVVLIQPKHSSMRLRTRRLMP